MGYFSLCHQTQSMAIKNKKRVAFIVSLKNDQIVIFYQNCMFEHINIMTQITLAYKKLNFCPTQHLKTDNPVADKIYLKGSIQQGGKTSFAMLNISDKRFKPYECIIRKGSELFQWSKHQLLFNQHCERALIVEITPNVENGVAISCLLYEDGLWTEQISYLGSKFLRFKLIRSEITAEDKTMGDSVWKFLLLSNGDKNESINVAQVIVFVENNAESSQFQSKSSKDASKKPKLKVRFNYVKDVHLLLNFSIMGAIATQSQELFMVGNCLSFSGNSENNNQQSCIKIDLRCFRNNTEPKVIFKRMKGLPEMKSTVIRKYLGQIQGDMLFIIESLAKHEVIHKVSPEMFNKEIQRERNESWDELLISLTGINRNSPQTRNLAIVADQSGLLSYQMICEQFFEKIKDSPSVIKFNYFKISPKAVFYTKILEQSVSCIQGSDQLLREIISLLQ